MKLVVIEGAGKVKTVEKYLGNGYKVFATKGHIRDLPAKSLAVNVKNNFEPKYEIMPDKTATVAELKKLAAKADEVYLATDPDREGEAISWHIANVLGFKPEDKVRIEFNEISQKAVKNGLEHPRAINENLVDAQQARRVLDRLVGYKLSPVLCKKIRHNLSAGRVQSVTLRLIVEREREIRAFKPEEYWNFAAILENDEKARFKAALALRNGKKYTIKSKEEVDSVLADLESEKYVVTKVKKTVTKSHAPAPFITSTMQQDALNKLGMSLKQTAAAAQALYEGVEIEGEGKIALITYIRTDSTRVAPDAIKAAREFITQKFGADYVPEKPNLYASKKTAQDAHEAIRPITLARDPESLKNSLKKEHYRLYKLIYDRFMASQMSEAKYNSVSVDISAGDYGFKVNGKTPLFKGYTAVYSAYVENEDDEKDVKLPALEEGEILTAVEHKYEQKFTKPPTRYTEASLVKLMEEKGIGRPATYVPTITLLGSRDYTEKEGKFLKPTKLGEDVVDMLVKYFPDIMDVGFTANMEEKLDDIEFGGKVWQKVIADFYDGFEDKISAAIGDSFSLKAADEKSDVICDKCGAQMVIRSGKFGKFLACPNFPKCKNTKPIEPEKPASSATSSAPEDGFSLRPAGENPNAPVAVAPVNPDEKTEICDKCGRPMVIKKGKYGNFWACTGYPECHNIKKIGGAVSSDASGDYGNCPECGKPLKKITTAKATFYGCTGYPECKFTSFDPLTGEKCPKCGSYTVIHTAKKGGEVIRCSNKDCDYTAEVTKK